MGRGKITSKKTFCCLGYIKAKTSFCCSFKFKQTKKIVASAYYNRKSPFDALLNSKKRERREIDEYESKSNNKGIKEV